MAGRRALVSRGEERLFDWQSTKHELKDRFEYIFNHQLLSDVQFIVGETEVEKIPALKVVLMAGSSVFFTMFSEKWSADCGEIEIPDITPATFKEFLRFLYSDKVDLNSETVIELLYTAKKYAVKALEMKCADFLQSKLCLENAFTILIQARWFEEEKLVDSCLEVISENAYDSLKTDDFCKIDVETLCLLLKRSDLRITEINLFEAVLRWSKVACEKENLPINPQNQRSMLKNAVSLLRFPLMSSDEFEAKVVDSGLLLETEIISMFRYFVNKSTPCVNFSETPRRSFYVASRYQSKILCLETSDDVHALIFSIDCNLHVVGIGLYGFPCETSGTTKYNVTIRLVNHHKAGTLLLNEELRDLDGSKKIFRVMFKERVSLTPNVQYRLGVQIQGSSYYMRGEEPKETVMVNLSSDKKAKIRFFYGVQKYPNTVDHSFSQRSGGRGYARTNTNHYYNGIPQNNNTRSTETWDCKGQIPEILFSM